VSWTPDLRWPTSSNSNSKLYTEFQTLTSNSKLLHWIQKSHTEIKTLTPNSKVSHRIQNDSRASCGRSWNLWEEYWEQLSWRLFSLHFIAAKFYFQRIDRLINMFCPSCGRPRFTPDQKYCSNCGSGKLFVFMNHESKMFASWSCMCFGLSSRIYYCWRALFSVLGYFVLWLLFRSISLFYGVCFLWITSSVLQYLQKEPVLLILYTVM
jgi:hypothetical protein